jgi:glutamine---fructose-6-phosphate transaminase (isomerizing)
MCGIIGYVGNRNAVPIVLEGLRRLEYRGYDSAGLAFFYDGTIQVRRSEGKISRLAALLEPENSWSDLTIGHTRWATHGRPCEENAHPHRSGDIVLVHNGIIENYLELKRHLQGEGYAFLSQTDTEVLCHLIALHARFLPLEEAVPEALRQVRGSYALAVISAREPGKIVATRRDSPLVAGIGSGEFFIASDIPAFLNHTDQVIFLDDMEMAVLSGNGVTITGEKGHRTPKQVTKIDWNSSVGEKGGYSHFMLKEIYEQPRAIADTLRGRFDAEGGLVHLSELGLSEDYINSLSKIWIVACGTSYHAGLIGKYLIQDMASIPVEVDIASEFRYRKPLMKREDLLIVITQSGETADTLAAQREAKKIGAKVLSICNAVGSTSSREADAVFYTHSGPEIGVASTKAFTTQIIALYLFSVAAGRIRKTLNGDECSQLLQDVVMLPGKLELALAADKSISRIAQKFLKVRGFLFLGRGIYYPVALEGALKLKEISYIHAEGYPAGEMKHGPIALIDEELPVVVLAPKDALREKVLSNIEEVRSRGGRIIVVTEEPGMNECEAADECISVPHIAPYLMPVLMTVPLQLLAYHIAVLRGCDVDQPRNLAKSVTVE